MNKKITKVNRTVYTGRQIKYIVIHWVGAASSAKNNVDYFYAVNRGSSAHFFVDDKETWQCVELKDAAWHVGAKVYYNSCRNSNSIGIEMCCKMGTDGLYIDDKTIERTIELTKELIKEYNIDLKHIVRHYDVTRKKCPAPFVDRPELWKNFKERLREMTTEEKLKLIQDKVGLDDNTMQYLQFYRYGDALIDKLANVLK